MSLEVALQENTKAVLALTALMSGGKAFNVEKATADAKAEIKAAQERVPAKTVVAANVGEATPSATLDYERDVKPKALAVAKTKGRDALVAILAEFGLKGTPDAKPEQYPELVKKFDAALV